MSKISAEIRQPPARPQDSVKEQCAHSFDYFSTVRKGNSVYLRKAHRRLESWSRRLIQAEIRTEQLPDSPSNSSSASIKQRMRIELIDWKEPSNTVSLEILKNRNFFECLAILKTKKKQEKSKPHNHTHNTSYLSSLLFHLDFLLISLLFSFVLSSLVFRL